MPTTAPSVPLRPALRVIALLAAASLAGCDQGPASPDGGPLPVALGVRASFSSTVSGDDGDAYDAADAVWVRLGEEGRAPVVEEVFPFDPTTENRVTVELELDEPTTMSLEVELRRGSAPLFEGSTSVALTPGLSDEVDIELSPVAAGLEVSSPFSPLTSLGETTPLESAVLFATGDTARGLTPDWTSLDPGVADIVDVGGAPHARAVSDGVAELRASFASFVRVVAVTVDIRVATVHVTPESSEIDVGQTTQLTAVARDALENELTGRATAWSSSDEAVATVNGNGLVTGVAPGVVQISAVVDDVEGTAEVEVVARVPEVTTTGSEDVRVTSARLRGVVRPGGLATTAWFEWGTDPELATSERTGDLPVGSGGVDVPISTTVSGLAPDTRYYFRAAASNSLGTGRGEILSFVTPPVQPPTVVTEGAEDVGLSSATVLGTVSSNGAITSAWFEFTSDPDFVEFSSTGSVSLPPGAVTEAVEELLTDLGSESTYYFRAAASNSAGTTRGEVLEFRTRIPAPSNLSGGFDGPTVFLGWDDNSTTDTYFRMERSETSPTSGFEVVGIILDDAADFDRDFFDEGSESDPLPTGTLYYRVFACNDDDCSDPSKVHSVVNLPSIGGRVDYCSDGCYGAGFEVTLTGPVNRSTVTNSFGFYDFPDVPVGTYTVTVSGDFCPEVRYVFDPSSKEVTVSSGGEFAVVDFFGSSASCAALR